MPRIARIVLPGVPHHVTQRGNRRQQTFFCEDDYQYYLHLLGQWCARFDVDVDAYCLMPNHVHLILVPPDQEALSAAISEIHRRYTLQINQREGWQGHLWQGRFYSVPLDEGHHEIARSYIALNPVRSRLAATPERYPWSSAFGSPCGAIRTDRDERTFSVLRRMTATGRPLGSEAFYKRIEAACGIDVRPKSAGRPRRNR